MRVVTLLTDFGTQDGYVGAVKGTLLRLAPELLPVDLSHDIPPGDIEGGAFVLASALPTFAPGTIHLAVVDPGVGSDRRLLAVITPHGPLLAPDNGLATPWLEHPAFDIQRSDLFLSAPGRTFHGRDRLAPVAAFLANGGRADELGPRINDARRLPIPPPRRETQRLVGRVAHIDRYGNLITDLPSSWLPEAPLVARVGANHTSRRVTHYAELNPNEAALLPGSGGSLELALRDQSLAQVWRVERGQTVEIEVH